MYVSDNVLSCRTKTSNSVAAFNRYTCNWYQLWRRFLTIVGLSILSIATKWSTTKWNSVKCFLLRAEKTKRQTSEGVANTWPIGNKPFWNETFALKLIPVSLTITDKNTVCYKSVSVHLITLFLTNRINYFFLTYPAMLL